jgi:serine/threonine-protein kinase
MADILDAGSKYLVHHRLGHGGMGAVHLGTMVGAAGERPVAVKQVLLRGQANPGATDRIVAEARLVFQLVHANICQVLDLAVNEEGTFIVMEFIDGCDLEVLLRRARESGGAIEPAAAIFIAKEVAAALDYAHRRKDAEGRSLLLIHGDVTPRNILLSREGEVKLADFGIARALGVHAPGNELSAGTPGFVAPEVLRGESDQRTDLYSLGVTLSAALTGQQTPALAPALSAIVERLTATRLEDRYSTAREVEETLSRYLARQYPSFTRSRLAAIVDAQSNARAAPTEKTLATMSLVSLTGTSPLGAPSPTEGKATPSAGPRGTRRVERPPAPVNEHDLGQGRRRRRAVVAGLGAAAVIALATWPRWEARRPSAPRPAPSATGGSPATVASASVPPVAAAFVTATARSSVASIVAPIVASVPTPASAVAPAVEPKPVLGRGQPDHARTRGFHASAHHASTAVESDLAPRPQTVEMGYLTVHAEPWGTVLVDGRRFADQTPVYRAPISVGVHHISVFNPESKKASPSRELTIQPGQARVVGFEW